jgi:hypothetical protein
MRSLYRGLFVHLDSLWRFSYLANTIIRLATAITQRPANRLGSREMLGRRQPHNLPSFSCGQTGGPAACAIAKTC